MSRAAALLLTLSSCFNRGLGQDGCSDLSAAARVVTTPQDASALTADLASCPGLEFNVFWRGSSVLLEPLQLSKSTILRITSLEASVLDGGQQQLFVVSDSSVLVVEGMGLTGGEGGNGAVVAASGGASVTFVDCDVYGNRASSNGGVVFLDDGSSFAAGGVNFTGNSAEVYGGVIHAQNESTVTTQAGTSNIFHGNSARLGGAIHVQDDSDVILGSGGDVTLSSNSAALQGGAVHLERSCMFKTDGVTWLIDNEAGNSGGAVWASEGSEVVATGNTTFVGNACQNYGGAVMVTANAVVRTREDTNFTSNYALNDGGAIQAEYFCRVQIAGRTLFLNNTVGNFGGAINAYEGVTVTTVGDTKYVNNTAEEGGAVYADLRVTVILSGEQFFEGNSAGSNGGAIHLSLAQSVTIAGRPTFNGNLATGGSGGAIYSGSVPQMIVKNANFTHNLALWGGAVASFSSGGSTSSSSSSSTELGSESFLSSASDYDPNDLTPSLTTTGDGTTVTSLVDSGAAGASSGSVADDGDGSDAGSGSGLTSPVKYLDCLFGYNHASEDGGAIYSVAGFDLVRGSHFLKNMASSSGGALVHAGVMEEVSDTVFEGNGAGNEGPAVLSLGLLGYMGGVTFDSNEFFCEEGKFSTETRVGSDASKGEETCRFARVCSRCASECDSDLESEVTVLDAGTLPACEVVPEGSQTTSRGGTLATLELLPGFYRSSETSTDIRECFQEDACDGGKLVGDYCANGYGGPYCAVCTDGYSPGYAHTCKSCLGDSKRRALAAISSIALVALVAVSFLVAKLVSVVETGPPRDKEQGPWQRRCSTWQARMKKTVPLTAVKIVVVVWQIVTQYSDVAGVKYPGAYNDFLAVVDVVNLDLGFILSFACVYDTNFYDRLLMATVAPAVVLCLLASTYLVGRHRNQHSVEAIGIVQRRHLSVALFVLFVVYATASYTVFETFVCDPLDDGRSYLRADYSITCGNPVHTAYRVYAGLMILVYPVGVPCVFGWWLFKYRHELTEEDRDSKAELRPLADLWEPYKRKKYYYEVVECFRRIALTGFAVFISPDSSAQIAIVLLLAAVFMVVSEILAPFAKPVEMWLYRAGHYVVFASMYLALLLRVDVSDEQDQSQEVFSGVIVIAHAVMLLVVVAQGLLIFVGWGDLVETPGALAALERNPTPDVSKSGGLSHDESGGRDGGWGGSGGPRDADAQRGYLSGSAAGTGSWPPGWGGGGGRGAAATAAAEEESKRQTPNGKKVFGNPGCNSKGAGARKESKWGAWEKPLQNAKNSFFPSPANSGRQVGPAAADRGNRKEEKSGQKGYFADQVTKPAAGGGAKGGHPAAAVPVVKASSSWASAATGGGGAGASASGVCPEKAAARKSLPVGKEAREALRDEEKDRLRSASPKRWLRDRFLAGQDHRAAATPTAEEDAAIKAAALGGVAVDAAPAAAPAESAKCSTKGSMARSYWTRGGRSSTGGTDIFPTGTLTATAPGRRSRSPRAREECPPSPTDRRSVRAERARNLEPPAPDGPPTMWGDRSTSPDRKSRRVRNAYAPSGGSAGDTKRDIRAREIGGGLWATAPHAPSGAAAPAPAPASTFASGGAAGAAASTGVQQRSFDVYASTPVTSRRRLNMQVILSPDSTVSSSMLGVPAPAPAALAPSVPQVESTWTVWGGAGVGGSRGRGRGREAAKASTNPLLSTAGLFGKPLAPAASTGSNSSSRGRSSSSSRSSSSRAQRESEVPSTDVGDGPRMGRSKTKAPWVPGSVGTGQRSATTSPATEERNNSMGEDAAKLFPEDGGGTFASNMPTMMKTRGEKNELASSRTRENAAAAAAPAGSSTGAGRVRGGHGGAAGGGHAGGDDLHAPPFTRDFRSLSGSSIGGSSGMSFGGLGGGGGGFAGNAKRSFFPDALAPFCSGGASSRGSGVSGFSGIVSRHNDGSSAGGAGGAGDGHNRSGSNAVSNFSRGGLLQRNRKDILEYYRNGDRAERVESFEAEVAYNRPYLRPLEEQAVEGKAKAGAAPQQAGADATAANKARAAEAKAAAATRRRRWGGGRRLLTSPDL